MSQQPFRRAFGGRVQAARSARGLTQRALAEKAGTSDKFLSRIETGHAMPSVLVASRIARALGVSLDELAAIKAPSPNPKVTAILSLLNGRSDAELDRAARLLEALFEADA